MRPALLFILFPLFIFFTSACKEVHQTAASAGINVMIHDIPCAEVKDRVIKELNNQGLSFEWLDQEQGRLSIGPLTTSPIPPDSFLKMEEKVRLVINCIDPISTRISVQIQLKALSSDNRWVEIKDSDKLTAYGKRFLDSLINK
jgi:hypothetical protein